MNNKFTNPVNDDDDNIASKLSQVAEKTHVNAQFAAELEDRLHNTHQPKISRSVLLFRQISPALRWVALMILLALVLSWSIRTLIPAPQPAINSTPTVSIPGTETATTEPINITATPITKEGGYDFRGAKLYLAQPLPASPDKTHIYTLKKDAPATQEQASAFADRFGIQGEIYTAPDYIFNTTDYLFTDGKQFLQVYSNRFFTYTADSAKSRKYPYGIQRSDHAEATIHEFLQARALDFPFSIYTSDFPGEYTVKPLAPDSIPMGYESFTQPVMRVGLDENGDVLSIDAVLMDYDAAPVGEYGIISAQEALQRVLNDNVPEGKMEFFSGANNMPKEWYRSYPDHQAVTIYGYLSSNPALDPGKPALILIDGVSATGNISGLESLDDNTFVKATGQYLVENGIRRFNIESWDRKIQQIDISGTLSRQGDQIILTSDNSSGQQYPLIDPPADLPVDTNSTNSQLSISGVIVDGRIFWTYIQLWENGFGGGGGGGNGVGFYQLNLTGPAVAFPPTAIPQPAATNVLTGAYTIKEGDTLTALAQTFGTTVDELMRLNNLTDSNIYIGQTLNVPVSEMPEQPVQDLRGYLSISVHNKSDGTSSREYNLEVEQDGGGSSIYSMEGPILSELDAYNALPILVTGKIDKTGKLVVDSYKIPYPDLHFQILKGTQKTEQLNGQGVTVFTTEDGKPYVEFLVTNNIPNTTSVTGVQGDLIQQEVLIIPDETFGGLPVTHIYQSSIVQENGPEMQPLAGRVQVFNPDNDPSAPVNYTQPNLTIDQVELAYYVSNPYYQVNDPNYSQRSPYIQPVWHFHGHYEDGGEFDVLIQAIKQEFLLPELAPGLSPG
jgi:LysM repeat protein